MKAYILSLNPDADLTKQWDFGFVKDILEKIDAEVISVNELPIEEAAIIAIPARHHAGLEDKINAELAKIKKVVFFCMGDEEADFDIDKIKHSNILTIVQNAHPGKHDKYITIGTGYPSHISATLANKDIDVFFAGQITHNRRTKLAEVMEYYIREMDGNAIFKPSKGFTQGLAPKDYYDYMSRTKIVPAPSGAIIPDSFRLYEALECMAIPIADEVNPSGTITQYWDWLFGEDTPFPKVTDWDRLPALVEELKADYPRNLHHITAWYVKYKNDFAKRIRQFLDIYDDKITVVMPTSVLPSHPDTRIIDQTIKDIRVHLPKAEIIMQIDGLRDEQKHRQKNYDDYKTKVLWKCLHEWDNVTPVVFDELNHQTNMLKATIDIVTTPLLLYVEGDAPLTPDRPIDWDKVINKVMSGEANTVRFHHENVIPREHDNLMLGPVDDDFRKTIQWSQRPHLSSVLYYKDVVIPTLGERTFIEDGFHGEVMNDYHKNGMLGWFKHRLWIYHPSNGIQRSYTTDGREGTRKFTSDDEAWGYKE